MLSRLLCLSVCLHESEGCLCEGHVCEVCLRVCVSECVCVLWGCVYVREGCVSVFVKGVCVSECVCLCNGV